LAKLINLKSFKDERGELTVIEKELSFTIKRVYYIYNLNRLERGFHRHKETIQAMICISGSCTVFCKKNKDDLQEFILSKPNQYLLINPEDYHWMTNFKQNTIILVLASKSYDVNDYIDKPYE